MENNTWMPIMDLVVAAMTAREGAARHGTEIGLHHNNTTAINADLRSLRVASNDYEMGVIQLDEHYKTFAATMASTRAWVTLVRDNLKPHFGSRYSQAWDTAGFRHSIVVPKLYDGLSSVVERLKEMFKQRPELEVGVLGITAAAAETIEKQLNSARRAVVNQNVANKNLLRIRNEKVLKMRHRLRGTINELKQLIPSNHPIWGAFGFNLPSALKRPEAPEAFEVKQVAEQTALAKWKRPARAVRYRLWMRVVGVDAEMSPVGKARDLRFYFDNLPKDGELEFAVSAINRAGESALSAVVRWSGPRASVFRFQVMVPA